MTTLVTGGNGWVPGHIVRRLARRGEPVISYGLMEPDAMLPEFLAPVEAAVIIEAADITDRERLRGRRTVPR